jgi:adenine deaminase
MRHLNTEAAKAMKYGGLNETEALSLVTINPAKQLGVENRVGSIEPGKDADLTIFDKHPLSNYAKVTKVFIDGELYFDREKDLEERPGKEARKKDLIDKFKAQEKKDRKKPEPAEDKKSEEPGGVQ